MGNRVARLGPPLLIAVMVAIGVSLALPLLTGDPSPVASPRIPILVLLLLWTAFELITLFLQFGDEVDNAEEVILTDIPLALGLMLAGPAELIVVGVAVPVVVDLLRRHRTAVKQFFNGGCRIVEVTLAATVYHALAPAEPFSVEGWAVLSLALVAAGLSSALAVSTVISIVTGRLPGRDFVAHVSLAIPVSMSAAAVAFVAGLSLQHGVVALAPLGASVVALLALIWVSSRVTERHRNLASMHELGEQLASTQGVQALLRTSLDASCQILVAPEADVFLHPRRDGSTVLRLRRSPDGTHQETQVRLEDVPGGRGLSENRRSLAVSTELTTGQDLVLSVMRQAKASRPFRRSDVRLLTMIARQTAAEVQTAQLIERLRHDALHDALTGLSNRRRLLESIEARLQEGAACEVVWLGVHDLEAVNSALGYDRGDDLLVQIGKRLRAAAGPHAVVSRVGGAEFAVLLPVSSVAVLRDGVTTLLDVFTSPFLLTDIQVVARATAGLAVESNSTVSGGEDMLRRADIAMRYARRTGRPAERYVPRLESGTASQLALAVDLQSAIPGGELVLYGQPQVRLEDEVVTGIEALVRWAHPHLGLLSPAAFVPLAEQTGMDRAMTAWVLDAALAAQSAWMAGGLSMNVSVNIPPSALSDHHLRDLVQELLAQHRVPGEHLVLEITESGLFTNPAAASRVLDDLSQLGVRVSIDDFGTGFSSLARLRRLPVDEIKIDRHFVSSMMQDDDDAAIVRSVVDLSRALGLTCVAEGIEDAATYTALQLLGCDAAQGYHVAAPMPMGEISTWVRSRNTGLRPVVAQLGVGDRRDAR